MHVCQKSCIFWITADKPGSNHSNGDGQLSSAFYPRAVKPLITLSRDMQQ